jgi:hypothetical protein
VNREVNLPTPPQMTVEPWADARAGGFGHRPGSAYIGRVWLGALGPSATWAWLHLATVATQGPGSTLDMADLARSLGLGTALGPNGPLSRTLGRLAAFDTLQRAGEVLVVRRALPDMPYGLLAPAVRQRPGRPRAPGPHPCRRACFWPPGMAGTAHMTPDPGQGAEL